VIRKCVKIFLVSLLFVVGCLAQEIRDQNSPAAPSKSESVDTISKAQANAILEELREIRQLLNQQVRLLGDPSSRGAQPAHVQIGLKPHWHVMGSANAPVTIVEFVDLECPFCHRFHAEAFPLIKKNYIDTGKVKFVTLDMPMEFHRYALRAAEANRCSEEQGKYWEMRDAILNSTKTLKDEVIFDLARRFQLNLATLRVCIDSNKYREGIQGDSNYAAGIQISGTPSFVVGQTTRDVVSGVVMVGAQSYPEFQSRIEATLRERLVGQSQSDQEDSN